MFSLAEKQMIAGKIEELLLSLNHPEMSKEMPMFTLHVVGNSRMSWADIRPNWTFDRMNPPTVNAWNEVARDLMPILEAMRKCLHCGKETPEDVPFCSEECNSEYDRLSGENK